MGTRTQLGIKKDKPRMTMASHFTLLCTLALLGSCYGACPAGWNGFMGSCYLYIRGGATFFEGIVECGAAQKGAYLVEMGSTAENAFVAELAKEKEPDQQPGLGFGSPRHTVLLGLDDFAQENIFVFTMSHMEPSFNPLPWYQNEPNNYRDNENCVGMGTQEGSDYYGKWFDIDCHSRQPVMCEIAATPDEAPIGK